MAERPAVQTLRFRRSELAKLISDPALLRAFEALAIDVSETLPDAIEGSTGNADTLIAGAIFGRRSDPAPVAGGFSEADAILASEMFRHRAEPAISNASGADQILAAGAFLPRQQPATIGREADASNILAAQIFGA